MCAGGGGRGLPQPIALRSGIAGVGRDEAEKSAAIKSQDFTLCTLKKLARIHNLPPPARRINLVLT